MFALTHQDLCPAGRGNRGVRLDTEPYGLRTELAGWLRPSTGRAVRRESVCFGVDESISDLRPPR